MGASAALQWGKHCRLQCGQALYGIQALALVESAGGGCRGASGKSRLVERAGGKWEEQASRKSRRGLPWHVWTAYVPWPSGKSWRRLPEDKAPYARQPGIDLSRQSVWRCALNC